MFTRAVKEKAKLRLSIAGPAGSGKTFTALAIATGLAENGRIAFVDTEHGSASKYADIFTFDVAEMHAPFHPAKYVKAITAAAEAGYDVVILDSLSHAWNGTGGVLEIVEQASKKFRGNTYAGWQEGTPAHNALIEGIVGADIHVIGTMRSKHEYVLTEVRGKQTPQKVGMAPIQRDGFEYEFDVHLDMDVENNAIVGKTRCPALQGKVFPKPGQDMADILSIWLTGNIEFTMAEIPEISFGDNGDGNGDAEPNPFDDEEPEPEPEPEPKLASDDNLRKRFHATGKKYYGDEWDAKRKEIVAHFGAASSNDLTIEQAERLIAGMQARINEREVQKVAA